MKSRLVALSIFATGLSIALTSPIGVAAFALLLPLVAVAVGPRLELDRLAQAALTIGAMVVGILIPRLGYGATPPSPEILSDRSLLLGMPMLTVAVARALVARPVYGVRLTLAANLVALTAAGRAETGFVFPACAATAVLLGSAALRASDTARAPLRRLGKRHAAAVVAGTLVAVSLGVLSSIALPRVQNAIIARLVARLERNQTGLGSSMTLGDLAGLLQSDEVVLRVRGDAPPLLRGFVLSSYSTGRWDVPEDLPVGEVVETPTLPADPAGFVELEMAKRPRTYFTTLDTKDVLVSEGIYMRDPYGLAHPAGGLYAKREWIARGGSNETLAPSTRDLGLPPSVRQRLTALLASWGALDGPPSARLAQIEAHLRRDYRYSVDFERTPRVDPIIDFLFVHKEGHCEYFAGATALLARAANIPARVVTGYRVVETSPLGYHIVRERNAHAWTEIWIDDAWQTVDTTPASDLAATGNAETPWLAALVDGVSTSWEAIDDWLGRRTPFELSFLLVGLFAVLLLGRALRNRLATKPGETASLEAPLPAYAALETALATTGLGREPSETLARFATRLEETDALAEDARRKIASAVRAYAGLRYASRGDERVVSEALADATRAARRGVVATSSA